ncbi:hypothetical protein PVAND_013480 [Polypedilum vanderplanki]|uniref:Malonyl-CoA:ACP transacylase (MAT) domain-containing protein n=1 Tax=Polypedilum vanderplanki TaxID=319348 RepID=A0A9J6CRP7_POLVA|nr:hypothetical protein PVAND_013480 [Polypedilum vanderplanki]
MVLWAGRTEEAINTIFDDITSRPLDAEHIALLQNSQVQTTSANTYRGFGMFINDASTGKAVCTQRDIQYFNGTRRPIVFCYSGMDQHGQRWILLQKGIDLKSIITCEDKSIFNNVMHSYVGIVSIEIALTDILKSLGIEPDYIIGHSVGELGCAYADNLFDS